MRCFFALSGRCVSRRLSQTALVLGMLAPCPLLRAQNGGYIINTVAGSAWVGDNGAATSAILTQAEGIAADSLDNLYIADAANHRIRKVTRAGVITTFAGTGVPGFSGDGGPAAVELAVRACVRRDGQSLHRRPRQRSCP
jgi:hypothetical protein